MNKVFSNWAGNIQISPEEIAYPTNEEQVSDIVKRAEKLGKTVRVVGSAHSWTALFDTNQILVSLDKMQGLISTNGLDATVWGGTKLKALGELLYNEGLAMENLGDIDVQAIAGAASTGTHGTGIEFRSISNQICKIRMVTGGGEIVECSFEENPELFDACRVSLGSMGIITQITLRCVKAYTLTYKAEKENLFQCLDRLDEYNTSTRNFEFYYFPHSETVQTKFINKTENAPVKDGFGRYFNDVILENKIFGTFCEIGRIFPSTAIGVAKIAAFAVGTSSKTNLSHRIFATLRDVRFNEMEYNIPAQNFKEAITRVKKYIEDEKVKVTFPIECRFVKSDNIYLSPAYQRESAYLSFHMYKGMPHQEYFSKIEKIMHEYEGRPHWGKMHNVKSDYLKKRYPKWDEFLSFREKLDPKQTFINPYLKELFGI
jgi:FAD-linked oxidoreductase